MARPTKDENLRNPLRQLRELMSEKGGQCPITQNELSELCDIPIDTIRSIEGGRRALNSTVKKRISDATRAFWNEEQMRWTLEGGTEPFTSMWYRVLKTFHARKPPDEGIRIAFMHQRLDALFERVSDRGWHLLARRINECLEECKDGLRIKGVKKVFDATTPKSAAEFARGLQGAAAPTYLHAEPVPKKEKAGRQKRSRIEYERV